MKDATVFSEYARCYDLLYKDKDYVVEVDYVVELLQRLRPGSSSILELGSGTGKHAVLLADRGYAVFGIERSAEMLSRARDAVAHRTARGFAWTAPVFIEGDIRTANVEGKFDAVISLFHVLSYQVTNLDLGAVFTNARKHLVSGGLFIFDVWYGPAVLTERPKVRIKRMADDSIEVTRCAEPEMSVNENLVKVNYHVFMRNKRTQHVSEMRETHEMRYLFKPEIEFFSQANGFSLVAAEEWRTGRPLAYDTWGACFVLRAR